ncbi:MAG TPA: hypothetical protein PKD90_15410 [Phnomibacter sp.]|nr:hypothetical protein [Phnomibacter sp.]
MHKSFKWLLGIVLGLFILMASVYTWFHFTFKDWPNRYVTLEDVKRNYDSHHTQLAELRGWIDAKMPTSKAIDIEFASKDELFIFHVTDHENRSNNWNVSMHSKLADSLLQLLHWNKQDLPLLKQKLEAANCISIQSGQPAVVGFQRSGFGKYYYLLFNRPLNGQERLRYNDSCSYLLHNDTVVLEYGGGAVGAQCFPGIRKNWK